MKRQTFGLFVSLTFVGLSVLFPVSANANEGTNIVETERDRENNSKPRNDLPDDSQRFQPIRIDLNRVDTQPFPIRLRDSTNNDLNEFYNSNKGDRGQVFILEYRLDFD